MAVLNKYKSDIPEGSVYIGRGSMWGNPYVMETPEDRDWAIDQYEAYLIDQISKGSITIKDLLSLEGKDLVCFCAPKRCHGDVIEKFVKKAIEFYTT